MLKIKKFAKTKENEEILLNIVIHFLSDKSFSGLTELVFLSLSHNHITGNILYLISFPFHIIIYRLYSLFDILSLSHNHLQVLFFI